MRAAEKKEAGAQKAARAKEAQGCLITHSDMN